MLLRSMEPSAVRTSGLAARKLRVNRTFSTKSAWDSTGMLLMSKLVPQVDAAVPAVWLDVYEA